MKYAPTAPQPHFGGMSMKQEPAANAPAPASHGFGTHPDERADIDFGSRKATTVSATQRIAADANCQGEAMKRSSLSVR